MALVERVETPQTQPARMLRKSPPDASRLPGDAPCRACPAKGRLRPIWVAASQSLVKRPQARCEGGSMPSRRPVYFVRQWVKQPWGGPLRRRNPVCHIFEYVTASGHDRMMSRRSFARSEPGGASAQPFLVKWTTPSVLSFFRWRPIASGLTCSISQRSAG